MSSELKFKADLAILPKLTDKQQNLLVFIAKFLGDELAMPTHIDMCRFMNLKTNNAGPYLAGLAKKGYMRKDEVLGFVLTENALKKLERMGKSDVLNKIAVRGEEQGSLSF